MSQQNDNSELIFFLNGRKVLEKNADPEFTLLQYLRTKLLLKGTKQGCNEGGCGACTVMISRFDKQLDRILHYSVNACLTPLCSLHGLAVTTLEGIGSIQHGLHPVQERLSKSHGSQCGFCTPGMIMSMYALLRNQKTPSMDMVEKALEGNLCRCTGYRPILDGFKTFTKEYCEMGENCCRKDTTRHFEGNGLSTELTNTKEFQPLDSTQDPIFPPELKLHQSFTSESLVFRGDNVTWYRPSSLEELLNLKAEYPDARVVVGNTEVGIEMKFKNMKYPVIISPSYLPELTLVQHNSNSVTLGAAVTLTQIETELKDVIRTYQEHRTRAFAAIVEMLRWFAGSQIRNVACLGGNIVTASPISDLNPLLMASGAELQVQSSARGKRLVKMDSAFFKGYRRTDLRPDEVLVSVNIPFTSPDGYIYGYKQAYRREDDIAIVNAGMMVTFEPNSDVIKELRLAYGGMAPVTVMATETMASLVGRRWDDSLVKDVSVLLSEELTLSAGAPGGMVEYRKTLAVSFFFKFYLSVQLQLQNRHILKNDPVPDAFRCATKTFHRDSNSGTQVFEEVEPGQVNSDPVGRPLPHMSAFKQTTGEATYVDDIPSYNNELFMSFVYSTKAHARIVNVDAKDALHQPGVVDFIGHKDVRGNNLWGAVFPNDEEIFASQEVLCQGQVIGAVVAESQHLASKAAKLVRVEYQELEHILTIKDAIAHSSYHGDPLRIACGDVERAMSEAGHIVTGEVHIGGQEHFYLETQASMAVPGEDEEMELFVSTQSPTDTQMVVAQTLNVSSNKIVCRVKRLGGAFGGKQSRSIPLTASASVAAKKLGRPVRFMLEREDDMVITGTRHPFFGRYKAAYTADGKIVAADIELFANAGMSIDLSYAVVEKALLNIESAYKIPNLKLTGHVCKTNLPSCTAFRAFGGPQAMMVMEQLITDVAVALGASAIRVRELSFYQDGDLTHYNQEVSPCHVQKCWDHCLQQSQFYKRREEVELFNSQNRWKKKGITVVPVKFGIGFEFTALNQAGALVHIYQDGSVLVTHAGVEMGQGLHTKMIQVASRALGVPEDFIRISETATNLVPNTTPTAASIGSDVNGMAVMYACKKLLRRMDPVIQENPKGSWEDWVKKSYNNRISLSATGFYATPDIGYDVSTNTGRPFDYYTFGAACSEVEIDCLTGDHQVLRTDIVMDVGTSLNPAIDIGQIEGAFVQGYGLFMMEQMKVSPSGYLFTRGPGTYKIPGFGDIPVEFNVSVLKGSTNPRAVYSSKAVGEPPLFLSASVFFAVKEAIMAARSDAGYDVNFRLHSPATAERIRMACEDEFTEVSSVPNDGSHSPWFLDHL